jgi:hypothetical protein
MFPRRLEKVDCGLAHGRRFIATYPVLAAAIYFASWAVSSALIYEVLRFIAWIFVPLECAVTTASRHWPPGSLFFRQVFRQVRVPAKCGFRQVRAQIVGIAPIRCQLVDERVGERWASSSLAPPCRSAGAR